MEFEKFPPDLRRKFMLDYLKTPHDVISLCATNQSIKNLVCNDEKMWKLFLIRDFPEAFYPTLSSGLELKNFKNAYIRNAIRIETFLKKELEQLRLKSSYFDELNKNIMRLYPLTIGMNEGEIKEVVKKYIEGDFNINIATGILELLQRREKAYLEQREKVLKYWKTKKLDELSEIGRYPNIK